MMSTCLQEPVPFTTEMEWRNLAQRHGQQLGCEIGCQFPVAFDSLGREFLFGMLAKELSQQHRERGRKHGGNTTGAGLCQLVLLEFLRTALRLGVNRLTAPPKPFTRMGRVSFIGFGLLPVALGILGKFNK